MKAYTVTESDEYTGGIIFARFNAEARRIGASVYGDGDFRSVECRRSSQFDQYYPGPVPKKALIENGWWFECNHCGRRIESDYDDEDYDPITDSVEDGDFIYCHETCKQQEEQDRIERKKAENSAIDIVTDRLLTRFPGAVIERTHAYVVKIMDGFAPRQIRIYFRFPGCKIGSATFNVDGGMIEPEVRVCSGDLDAFNRWRDLGYGVIDESGC